MLPKGSVARTTTLASGFFQFVAEQVVARCARALLRETFYPGVVPPDPEVADGRIHFLHFAGKFPVLEYLDFPFAAHAREKYVGKYDVAAHPVGIRGSFAAENVVPSVEPELVVAAVPRTFENRRRLSPFPRPS